MGDLPTTAIGLIGFLFVGAGYMVWRTQNTFMTYIEKKNGNLERATTAFIAAIEDQAIRHKDAMVNQNERHKQMMDDIAARLESALQKR